VLAKPQAAEDEARKQEELAKKQAAEAEARKQEELAKKQAAEAEARKQEELAKKQAAEEEARKQEELAKKQAAEEEARKQEELAKKQAAEEEARKASLQNVVLAEPVPLGKSSIRPPEGWSRREAEGLVSYRGPAADGFYTKLNYVTVDAKPGVTADALAQTTAAALRKTAGFSDVSVGTRMVAGKPAPEVTARIQRSGKVLVQRQVLVERGGSILVVTLGGAATESADLDALLQRCVENVQ
jgi:flagellar biosynthesis GTPase FlhF